LRYAQSPCTLHSAATKLRQCICAYNTLRYRPRFERVILRIRLDNCSFEEVLGFGRGHESSNHLSPARLPENYGLEDDRRDQILVMRVGSPPKKRILDWTHFRARIASCRPMFTVGKSLPPSIQPRIPTICQLHICCPVRR